ncbi:hypothetical protein QUW15_02365 [Desulfovibrio piger]|nr:hypothetical protein [Desulfovibrio piger]
MLRGISWFYDKKRDAFKFCAISVLTAPRNKKTVLKRQNFRKIPAKKGGLFYFSLRTYYLRLVPRRIHASTTREKIKYQCILRKCPSLPVIGEFEGEGLLERFTFEKGPNRAEKNHFSAKRQAVWFAMRSVSN